MLDTFGSPWAVAEDQAAVLPLALRARRGDEDLDELDEDVVE